MVEKKVTAMKADKIIYFWQPIGRYQRLGKVEKKIEMLGLQGATSGTNTKAVQTTQTKTAAIKTIGQTTQQRVVDVIFTDSELPNRLFEVWDKEEEIGLWRVDLNDIKGKGNDRTVAAEYSECLIPNFPNQEALNGVLQANITFEVQGQARTLDEDGQPYRLNLSDFADPNVLDEAGKYFYEFSNGMKPENKEAAEVDVARTDEGVIG